MLKWTVQGLVFINKFRKRTGKKTIKGLAVLGQTVRRLAVVVSLWRILGVRTWKKWHLSEITHFFSHNMLFFFSSEDWKNNFIGQTVCDIITHPSPYHGFISVSLIAGLICIERWSHGKYPMSVSWYGEGCVIMWVYFNFKIQGNFIWMQSILIRGLAPKVWRHLLYLFPFFLLLLFRLGVYGSP